MSFFQDVKFAVRMLLRDPGPTAVMIIALALGIGVNTTVFTLVNAVLFRGLPFEDPDRVMHLSSSNHAKNQNDIGVSYPDFKDWKAQTKAFKGMAGSAPMPAVINDDANAPERYAGVRVTSNFFSLVGQPPALGRDLLPEEDRPGAQAVAIIGYSIWENRYGRDPNILGKAVRINEIPTTIVGVMPKNMKFPVNADLWIPLVPAGEFEKRDARNVRAFGRLADSVSLTQARNEMETIARRLEKEYPKSNLGNPARGWNLRVLVAGAVRDEGGPCHRAAIRIDAQDAEEQRMSDVAHPVRSPPTETSLRPVSIVQRQDWL